MFAVITRWIAYRHYLRRRWREDARRLLVAEELGACRWAVNWVLPHFVWSGGSIRALSSSGPALPYIARLSVLRRLI